MALNTADDMSADGWQSQTHVKLCGDTVFLLIEIPIKHPVFNDKN